MWESFRLSSLRDNKRATKDWFSRCDARSSARTPAQKFFSPQAKGT
jgi:hypothetical protein